MRGRCFSKNSTPPIGALAEFVSAMFGSAPVVAPALEPVASATSPIISDTTKSEQEPASISPAAVAGSPLPAAGDTWTYQLTDPKRRHRQSQTHQVTVLSVTGDTIIEQLAGASPTAQTGHPKDGYLVRQGAVSLFSPYFTAFESLEPGAQMTKIENRDPDFCSQHVFCSMWGHVVGKEMVRVAAGEFETKRGVKFSSCGSYNLYIESDFDLELASYQLNG
jgi:hypothetical protein